MFKHINDYVGVTSKTEQPLQTLANIKWCKAGS